MIDVVIFVNATTPAWLQAARTVEQSLEAWRTVWVENEGQIELALQCLEEDTLKLAVYFGRSPLVTIHSHSPSAAALLVVAGDDSIRVAGDEPDILVTASASTPPETIARIARDLLKKRTRSAANGFSGSGEEPEAADFHLTKREWDVLALLAEGVSNKVIAHELSLSENTVKIYVRSLIRKFGVSNRTEVAVAHGRAAAALEQARPIA